MTKNALIKLLKGCVSKREAVGRLGWKDNGTSRRKFHELLAIHSLTIEELGFQFTIKGGGFRKYPIVERSCPICFKSFLVSVGSKRNDKITCSHACSNSYFRSGENNPNWKGEKREKRYRNICFKKWKNECAICKFNKIVDVHHIDRNRSNNKENNLIPLCPNHHRMFHTEKYHLEISNQITELIKNNL